jgi:hypothetical protein
LPCAHNHFVIRGPQRAAALFPAAVRLIIVAAYLFACYSWLWDAGYRSPSLAERTGLVSAGVTVEQLERRACSRASTSCPDRSARRRGHFAEARSYYFALSKGVYANIAGEIPSRAARTIRRRR